MITKFNVLDLNRPYFWVSDNALVEVKFSKAVIGTHDGEVTYHATLPNGANKTISSNADNPIEVYASSQDYINKRRVEIPTISLENIARSLKLQIRYRELDGEKVAFHFVVWTIDKGIAKEHKIYGGNITVLPNHKYEINDDFPENYHTDRATMEQLYATKVIAEDGAESVVGGELSSLLLSDEQKNILNEWLAATEKLANANIKIVSSESTGNYLAVNGTQIGYIYGYEESYEGIIRFDSEHATELHIPQIPLIVCNDYDTSDMWILMKENNE